MKEKPTVPCFLNPAVDCPPECPSYEKNSKRFIKSVQKANNQTGENVSPEEALTRMRAYAGGNNHIRSVLNLAVALANQEAIQRNCLNAKNISDNSGITVVRLD